jgi:hypothetical protein
MRCPHCGANSLFPEGYCILCGRPFKQSTVVGIPRRRARTIDVLSEEDKDYIQQAYKTHSAKQVAKLLGYSYTIVRKVLHERGVMRDAGEVWNDKKIKDISSSKVEDAIISTYKTHTLKETAKILSISRRRVQSFLTSRGLLRANGVRIYN